MKSRVYHKWQMRSNASVTRRQKKPLLVSEINWDVCSSNIDVV